MTRESIREYAEALRPRYLRAGKAEKGRMLDEFCRTTGYHRNAAMRVLRRRPGPPSGRRGRRRQYGPEVAGALRQLWEASDRLCAKRLQPFVPELVAALERHGELAPTPAVRAQLLRLSASTIDRLLRPFRGPTRRRPFTQSRSLAALKALVPLRTFGEWDGAAPGACQADLVSHCGESTEGFYLTSLVLVDVATSWTECEAIWGKGQERVGGGVHRARRRLPPALRELHVDNGGEFLNHVLYPYCRAAGVRLSRGRPYKKNDQAYVEQKNGGVVRRWVGYDRYSSRAAYAQLQRVYEPLRLYVNFFQPVQRLIAKERVGARVRKRYDRARTPYQRLRATGALDEAKRRELEALYRRLNPVRLRAQIDRALEALWRLAERPGGAKAAPEPAPAHAGAR
jgi:hypothetical protein